MYLNKQFTSELKKLCKKHEIDVSFTCQNCGHTQETFEFNSPDSYFVTFTPKKNKKESN